MKINFCTAVIFSGNTTVITKNYDIIINSLTRPYVARAIPMEFGEIRPYSSSHDLYDF